MQQSQFGGGHCSGAKVTEARHVPLDKHNHLQGHTFRPPPDECVDEN